MLDQGVTTAATTPKKLRIALISPRFEPSFYGLDYAIPLMPGRKKSRMIVGAVTVLAALTPEPHEFVLFDEELGEIDIEELRGFDVIGLTGMIVQRRRMFEWLDRLADLPAKIVVGGPYVTVQEEPFVGRADAIFIGEAEATWPQFLDDIAHGRPTQRRYEMESKPEMSVVPTPRFDLVSPKNYLTVPIQFSRGCPFMCEFCDIIVIFGRRPRTKAVDQIMAEIQAAYDAGHRYVFLVDDNFIGDKKAAKAFLNALIPWQKDHGYPLRIGIEATIDLADQPEILKLLGEANVNNVFIGVESPDEAALREVRKVQNIRGDSLSDKLYRIRQSGLVIDIGMIVGFDEDDETVFDRQFEFVTENGVATTNVSILSAIPGTPLFKRLMESGRIRTGDAAVNFEPAKMTSDDLKVGHAALFERLYTPEAFFGRVWTDIERSGGSTRRQVAAVRAAQAEMGTAPSPVTTAVGSVIAAFRLGRALSRAGKLGSVGRAYISQFREQKRRLGVDALSWPQFISVCLFHWHYYRFAEDISAGAYAERAAYGFALDAPPSPAVPAAE